MRFNEEGAKSAGESSKAKPKGKAAKKRAMASKLEEVETLFDNEEEELLFQVCFDSGTFVYLLIAGSDRRIHLLPIPRSFQCREEKQVPCYSPQWDHISALSPCLFIESRTAFRVL
jgi:hypothetical protein